MLSALGVMSTALWLFPSTASAAPCECNGTGLNGPVTVACGQSTCGTDSMTYSCSASGFTGTGQACSGCSCSGTGIDGPVTVACGQSVCGTDSMMYSCAADGFTGTSQACSSCSCSGTGIDGPVSVSCGQSVCGTDSVTYSCGASGFSSTGQTCHSCSCSGTGIDGPVTVACGQSVCGTDSMTYSCSASGFAGTGQSCSSTCSCSGTGINGPITVACGQSVCGTDSMSYSCSSSGFTGSGQSCAACSCSGTSLNGPVNVSCGQTTCGTDHMTYSCSAAGFASTGQSCGGGHTAPVGLGSAGGYVILAESAISTVPTSVVTGDLGLSPQAASFITGFDLTRVGAWWTSAQVIGRVFAADNDPPTPTNLTTAVADMHTAYTDAAGRPTPDFLNLGGGAIGGLTLTPGLYKWSSTVTIPSDLAFSGTSTDVWILQITGDLTMSSAKNITLAGGASASNIFWQVTGIVDIGTSSHIEGIVMAKTEIILETGASINGRLFSQTAVHIAGSAVTGP